MSDFEAENKITEKIIGHAIDIHNELGPGLLERAYQKCLAYLLANDGYKVVLEKKLPLKFRDLKIEAAFRPDMIVANKVIIELKTCDKIIPIHEAQLYTYLKLTDIKVGLILNFNEKLMKHGIKRLVMT